MFKKKRYIVTGSILLVVLGYLGFTALTQATAYYYTVDEVLSGNVTQQEENLKVSGTVVPGSLTKDASSGQIFFNIAGDNGKSLQVSYDGVLPDAFAENNGVVVDGYLDSNGVFISHSLSVKCPSRYVAENQGG